MTLDAKVSSFAKRASSVEHSGEVVCIIKHNEIVEMNQAIEPKIRQNKRERAASMCAAARCTVR